MKEQTTKLLEQLANKLGTTTEYLWGILLKQAYVSATTSLVCIIFFMVAGYVLYRAYRHVKSTEDNRRYSDQETYEMILIIMSIVWAVVLGMAVLMETSNIINGFLNPEYWALNKVLKSI